MKNYFPALTGLRFIAASMVFFHHMNPFPKESTLYNVVSEFHIGVTIFFCLSGFLIGLRYSGRNIDVKNYFINRFARIYPVYFLFIIIYYLSTRSNDLTDVILNITLLKGYFDDYKFSGVPQGWTLTVEETFYAFALLLFWLYKKFKNLILLIPVVLITIGVILVNTVGKLDIYGLFKNYNLLFNYTFFGRSFEFICGFILSTVLYKIKSTSKYITISACLMILLCTYLLSLFRNDMLLGINSIEGKIINNFILPTLGILPLIYGLIKEETFISKFLSFSFVELLGKSSYAFYLVHVGVVATALYEVVPAITLYFILQALSILIYKFYEEPLNKLVKGFFKPKALQAN